MGKTSKKLPFTRAEDGNLVVNEKEAALVRRIYRMFLQGKPPQHNMNAINSYNKSNANVAGMKSYEKLSSGYRINRAGDDAA